MHQQIGWLMGQLGRMCPHHAEGATDCELLARFISRRDESAFLALVQRHGPMVWGVCRRVVGNDHDAEDAFQATFLVLARKGTSVGSRGSAAGWLNRVAYHNALRARRRSMQTGLHADQVPDAAASQAASEMAWRELSPILDEEMQRLPDKYRLPLVLCGMQGMTRIEAALCLGWKEGTVAGRLARARALMQKRLARRGLTLAAGWLATSFPDVAGAAMVPAGLAEKTVLGALSITAGSTGAVGIPSGISILVHGTMRGMLMSNIKRAAVVFLLVMGIGLSAGGVWRQALAENPGQAIAERTPANAIPEAVPAAQDSPQDTTKPPQGDRAGTVRKKLATPIDTPAIDPNTPLKDALEFLSEHHGVTILVDRQAFVEIGLQQVGEEAVQLPRMKGVSLDRVLSLLLSQVRGDLYTGAYLLTPDGILVTTSKRMQQEVYGPEKQERLGEGLAQPPEAVVNVDVKQVPLDKALRSLAEEKGINIVIDARVGEKAKTPVSATMDNVLASTALEVLAAMADLKLVMIHNVYFITN